jgi:TPR repeat protein
MRRILIILLFAACALAQEHPLSQQDLLDLKKGGVSDQRIAQLVQQRGVDFDPTPGLVGELRGAGFDDAVIEAVQVSAAALHVQLGDTFSAQKDFAGAERKYRTALIVHPGDAAAQKGIASALRQQYLAGKPPAEDLDSVLFYRDAADRGRVWAQTEIGMLYETGASVGKDPALAATYYREAADQADAWSEYRLGMMSQGNGLPRDDLAAASFLRKAADQGIADAQLELALMYREGRGVAKDPGGAKAWLEKAAQLGNARAASLLKAAASGAAAFYGTVFDESGKPLAAATVTLANPATGFSQTVTSGPDGAYSFLDAPPGTGYTLAAAQNGATFDSRRDVALKPGDENALGIPLRRMAAGANTEMLPPRTPLQLTATASVQYWSEGDTVHLEFTMAEDESPGLDVDVDQDGQPSYYKDLSLALSSRDNLFCPSYVLRADAYTPCGGFHSAGKVVTAHGGNPRGNVVEFQLPKSELSANGTTADVVFRACRFYNKDWKCIEYPNQHYARDAAGKYTTQFAKTVRITLQ